MKLYRVLQYAHNDAPKSDKLATTVEGIYKLVEELLYECCSDYTNIRSIELDKELRNHTDIHFEYYDNIMGQWYKTDDTMKNIGIKPFILQVFDTID